MNKPTKQGWADDVVGYYRELNPGTPVPESLRKQADLLHGVFRGAKATARFLCGVSGGSTCLNPLPLKSPLLKGKRAQNITAVLPLLEELPPLKRSLRSESAGDGEKLVGMLRVAALNATKTASKAKKEAATSGSLSLDSKTVKAKAPSNVKVDALLVPGTKSTALAPIPCECDSASPTAAAPKAKKAPKPKATPPADLTAQVNAVAAGLDVDELLASMLPKKGK